MKIDTEDEMEFSSLDEVIALNKYDNGEGG